MINYIWISLILLSILCAVTTGRIEQLSEAVMNCAGQAVEVSISSLGLMCLWTGLMKIAQESGFTTLLAKILSPVLKFLFKDLDPKGNAVKSISMNLSANFLGIGNAATPFGLQAMKEMIKLQPRDLRNTASNSMIMFIVMNSACLQLVPTMLISLRVKHGAKDVFDILPLIWLTSFSALLVGIIIVKLFERCEKR